MPQMRRGDLQGRCKTQEIGRGDIAIAVLNLTDVRPVQPGLLGESRLGKTPTAPQEGDGRAKDLERCLLPASIDPSRFPVFQGSTPGAERA
jgi:hypothetical protein